MYATTVFQFHQDDNGWLMSEFAFMRSVFLIFLFPVIISRGRKWHRGRCPETASQIAGERATTGTETRAEIPTRPEEMEAPIGSYAEEEPVIPEPAKEEEGTGFDLFFLRWSLALDGFLTMLTAFATEKRHIYLGTRVSCEPWRCLC